MTRRTILLFLFVTGIGIDICVGKVEDEVEKIPKPALEYVEEIKTTKKGDK